MTTEIEIRSKDTVRLDILGELLEKTVGLKFKYGNDPAQSYIEDIHSEHSCVRVIGKFNIAEDNARGWLSIRPVMIEHMLKVKVDFFSPVNDSKTISVVRNGTKETEKTFRLTRELQGLAFVPMGSDKYLLKLSYAGAAPDVTPERQMPRPVREDVSPATGAADHANTSAEEKTDAQSAEPVSRDIPVDDRFESYDYVPPNGDSGLPLPVDLFESTTAEGPEPMKPSQETAPAECLPDSDRSLQYNELAAQRTDLEKDNYNLSSEIRKLETEISELEKSKSAIADRLAGMKDYETRIKAEMEKDYEAFERERNNTLSRLDADSEVLNYYQDNDIVSVESLLADAKVKLEAAEKQIRVFIKLKENKTLEIEKALKVGKK